MKLRDFKIDDPKVAKQLEQINKKFDNSCENALLANKILKMSLRQAQRSNDKAIKLVVDHAIAKGWQKVEFTIKFTDPDDQVLNVAAIFEKGLNVGWLNLRTFEVDSGFDIETLLLKRKANPGSILSYKNNSTADLIKFFTSLKSSEYAIVEFWDSEEE